MEKDKYYESIKEEILNNEITRRVKDYSKNRSDLNTYIKVGELLKKAGKHYGEGIIKKYAEKLTNEFGKKYTISLLYKIIQLYEIYEKVPTMSGILSWSHWYELLSMKNLDQVRYYITLIETQNLSVRELRSRIKNKEYERLDE